LRRELFIEFDGRQLIVRSDAAEIIDFASRTYQPMLVARPATSVGSIDIQRSNGEYVLDLVDGSAFQGDLESVCRYLRQQIQQRFIDARSDLMWLHAGAVARDGKCLLIAGPPASGKSTLVTLLCDRGWRMLSDDVAAIRIDSLEVVPYPERPSRRIYPGRGLPREQIGSLERESLDVAESSICRESTTIRGVVFPIFREGEPSELVRLSPGEVAIDLVRSCMNFEQHKAVAVTIATRIASTVTGHRLLYQSSSEAEDFLGNILQQS